MTRDDFRAALRRLALLAASCLLTLGLYLVGRYLGVGAFAAAAAGGLTLTAAATVTLEPTARPGADEPGRERRLTRRQIEAQRERQREDAA